MWIALAVGLALAADPPTGAPTDPEADESLTGFKPPPTPISEIPVLGPPLPADHAVKQAATSAQRGAEQLGMDLVFVQGIQEGLEKIYRRDYSGAKEYFLRFEAKYPNTAVASVADTLVWQALMLENFDYRYSTQYWQSSKASRAALEKALSIPGNEAWEHFLYGAVAGVESIHTIRTGSYLPALQLAFEALDHIQETRERAPAFTDLLLADGMYNYWRSVLTMSSKILPDFGDKRAEGLAQMKQVEQGGIFLAPAGTLSLTFSFLEEGQYSEALAACQKNRAKYPDNVINNMITGMTYIYLRKYTDAIRVFDEIRKDDPTNRRVRYWKGVSLLRSGQTAPAITELSAYLGSEYLEDWQKASTHWRLGQAYQREKRYAEADAAYSAAAKLDGGSPAKGALDALRDQRKKGQIAY